MDLRQIHSAILDIDSEISHIYSQLAKGGFDEYEEGRMCDNIEELLEEQESLSSLLPDWWEVPDCPPTSI